MSWRDSKGRWHGVPAYLGGSSQPTPEERKRWNKPPKPKQKRAPSPKVLRPLTAGRLAEISRRQMASSKKNG